MRILENFDDYTMLDLNIERNTLLNPPDPSGGLLFENYLKLTPMRWFGMALFYPPKANETKEARFCGTVSFSTGMWFIRSINSSGTHS